ncbi:pyridoxamine 5'-phosphate oxidase family protein [Pseudonocardia thermophila]|nr:pyridoxamine 5'-phosphate oxidase family protein [Pseudonocardia thermophila]
MVSPSAMVLATVFPDGSPAARTVLVTAVEGGALQFHPSAPTGKTRDLTARPVASGVFPWAALGRQAVVFGRVRELERSVTAAAFRERPEQLQRVAWTYEALLPSVEHPLGAVDPAAVVTVRCCSVRGGGRSGVCARRC